MIQKGKKKIYIKFGHYKVGRGEHMLPLQAKPCNVVEGLEEDEEEKLLRNNPGLVPLFFVNLDKLIKQMMLVKKSRETIKQANTKHPELKERLLKEEGEGLDIKLKDHIKEWLKYFDARYRNKSPR